MKIVRNLFHKGKKSFSGVVGIAIPETKWNAPKAASRAKMQMALPSDSVSKSQWSLGPGNEGKSGNNPDLKICDSCAGRNIFF